MAKQVKLKAEPRANVGRSGVNKLRARGIIPAVIYGGKVKPQSLQVTARDINAMMSHASGENVLVDLEIAGEKSNRAALVQENRQLVQNSQTAPSPPPRAASTPAATPDIDLAALERRMTAIESMLTRIEVRLR